MQLAYDHLHAEILSVRELTSTIKEFRLRRVNRQPLPFVPGEYVLYWTGQKYAAFSLASNPCEPAEFSIAVARPGPATEQLHRLGVGETIPFAGPFGPSFDQSLIEGRTLWFVAGGIGLAGLVAQIRKLETESRSSFTLGVNRPNTPGVVPSWLSHRLFYGVRNREQTIWKEELEQWRAFMNVEVTGDGRHLVGDLLPNFAKASLGQNGPVDNVTVLVCGPRPLAHAVFPILVKLGINPRYILVSIW